MWAELNTNKARRYLLAFDADLEINHNSFFMLSFTALDFFVLHLSRHYLFKYESRDKYNKQDKEMHAFNPV